MCNCEVCKSKNAYINDLNAKFREKGGEVLMHVYVWEHIVSLNYHTVNFGILGGGKEHRRLCVEDLTLSIDNELGQKYIEYNDRQSKTRTGENINNIRLKLRMYATGDDRYTIEIYKKYMDKRP